MSDKKENKEKQRKNGNIILDDLDENDVKELKHIIEQFIMAYSKKSDDISDEDWIKEQLKKERVNDSEFVIKEMARKITGTITEYNENLENLNETCKKGKTKECWFADRMVKSAIGTSVIRYGNYLNCIDNEIQIANKQLLRVITTRTGNINQSINLDGFLAEQYHVNTFNMRAALQKSAFRAEVCVPKPGQTYGLNSFDAVIKDGSNKIIHQYQFKYGSDSRTTINLIKSGNYNNQRLVVPSEQLEEVRAAFHGKSVEAHIGGTDKVAIESDSLTKKQVKDMQFRAQGTLNSPSNNWNDFSIKELANELGKNAGMAGVLAGVMAAGITVINKVIKSDPIEKTEVVKIALKTGADAGIKAAITGALKVISEREIIKVIPKGTPVEIIANIVCVAVENVKIVAKVVSGEYTLVQGIEQMGRTTLSMAYGISGGMIGTELGALVFSWIPIVGPIIGGIVGSLVGYAVGSKFGEIIYDGIQALSKEIANIVASSWNDVYKRINKNYNGILV